MCVAGGRVAVPVPARCARSVARCWDRVVSRAQRFSQRFACAVASVALVCLLLAVPAGAVRDHGSSLSFGSAGSEAGELQLTFNGEPGPNSGVAVNSATHDVYVADTGNRRVDQFSAAGTFVRAWGWGVADGLPAFESCTLSCQAGISGSGPGQFTTPTSVAVDNSAGASAGDVYVADTTDNLVQKFSGEGTLIESWGVKGQLDGEGATGGPFSAIAGIVLDTAGNLFVYDPRKLDMFEFEQDGTAKPTVTVERETYNVGIAVDGLGNLYKVIGQGNVEQFGVTGEDSGSVDPSEGIAADAGVAVDQSTNELYVAKQGLAIRHYTPSCAEGGPKPCTPGDSFGEGILSEAAGLAVDSSSKTVYAADVGHARIDAFAIGPDVTTEAATNVQPTSATVNGSVNPDSVEVSDCHFDYGTTTSYGQVAPCVPSPGSGSTTVAVHADLNGLTPGATYHFRLEATSVTCAACTSFGEDETLSTPPPPSITSPEVANLTATSAELKASVNPNGVDTKYHFEWGTSASYTNSTPVEDAGEGTGAVPVSTTITGLEANKTYHWRLVAENLSGTVSTTDQTFIYDTTPVALPDNRAYEMVTPAQKNGSLVGDVFALFAPPPQVAASGSRVVAEVIQCFAEAESCPADRISIGSPYAFTRTPGGWQATALAPSAKQLGAVSSAAFGAETGGALFAAPEPGATREAFYVRREDGSLGTVGPITAPGGGPGGITKGPELTQIFMSADLATLTWETIHQGNQIWPFDETNTGSGHPTAYEYVGAAHVQPLMVGVKGGQNSTELISECGTELARAPGTLSSDGHTLYFVAVGKTTLECPSPEPRVGELFARIDNGEADAHTIAISQPQALGPAPDEHCKSTTCVENTEAGTKGEERWRGASLYGASTDGQKAFFGSPQQLLDSASEDPNPADTAVGSSCRDTTGTNGCNLYESDLEEAAGRRLIDVSAGDKSGEGPRVRGTLGISSDGSHVYFAAGGVLTSTPNERGQLPQNGGDNLYAYERDPANPSGHVTFIATLQAADAGEWNNGSTQDANVTPDGRYLVFRSHAQLTADDTSESGAAQIFRYDAQTGQLLRISTGNEGFNNNGNRAAPTPCTVVCSEDAWLAPGHAVEPLGEHRRDPSMSDNGEYVFFQSPVALGPGALDDAKIKSEESTGRPIYAQNVYEWHAGHVHLISDGHDVSVDGGQAFTCGENANIASSDCLLGSDASGANVFFSTADRLTTSDTDTELDYYDARICTESSPCIKPSAEPAGCSEDTCQGASSPQPAAPLAASITFSGPGNTASGAPRSPQGRVHVLTHLVRGSRFSISVTVNTSGRISLRGAAIRTVHASLARPGVHRFQVKLTPRAAKALRHHRGAVLRLRVVFAPTTGTVSSLTVTLKARP
jgi:hypothetical protein